MLHKHTWIMIAQHPEALKYIIIKLLDYHYTACLSLQKIVYGLLYIPLVQTEEHIASNAEVMGLISREYMNWWNVATQKPKLNF